MSATTNNTTLRYSRRTVAKGLAWATPVVIVAQTAPAFALSGPQPNGAFIEGWKLPGGSCHIPEDRKGYAFKVSITNTGTTDIWVYPSTIKLTVGTGLDFRYAGGTTPIKVPAGQTITVTFRASGPNSANQSFTGSLAIDWGHCATVGCDPNPHPALRIPISITETSPDHGDCGYST